MQTKYVITLAVVLSLIVSAFGIREAAQINQKMNNSILTKDSDGKFVFPALPYSYDALEPYIDKMTMEIHYSKHHRTYYDNFIKSIAETEMEQMNIEQIFAKISTYSPSVRNNGGGYYNHVLFWESLSPVSGKIPEGDLLQSINKKFGSFEEFKIKFSEAAKARFGSGWVWLSVDAGGQLFISSTANQDNPLMDIADQRGTPILALDVWEHAYYLKYQNKRVDYIAAFWNVVDWKKVAERYSKLKNR